MAHIVQVEYNISDYSDKKVDPKKKSRRSWRSPTKTKAVDPNAPHFQSSPSKNPPDGFVPMEVIEKLQKRLESANPSGKRGSVVGPPSSAGGGGKLKPTELFAKLPPSAVMLTTSPSSEPLMMMNRPPRTEEEEEHKGPVPSRPNTANAATKRQSAYDRFQAPPPMWKFSEKIDMDMLLLDQQEYILKFQHTHRSK